MFSLLVRLATRFAVPTAVVGLTLVALAGVFGIPVAESLTGGNRDFRTPGSQSAAAEQVISDATGAVSDGGVVALIRTAGPVTDPAGQAEVDKVAAILRGEPAIIRVLTYADTQDPGMLSTDGRGTTVVGLLRAGDDDAAADTVERLLDRYEDDPVVTIGGSEVVNQQIVSMVQRDLARAELLVFPLLFLLSLWIFRSLVASTLPIVIGGLNLMLTLLGIRVVNEYVEISTFALNLVVALGLGLAIDYSLLLVSRFRAELALVDDVRRAIDTTVRTAGRTILFSALTVAAAMASLLTFDQPFLFSMAVGGVLVAVSAALVSLLILPALLCILGRRIDFLSPPRWRRALEQPEESTGGWFTLGRAVTRRPGLFATGAALVLLALALPLTGASVTTIGAKDLPVSESGRATDDAVSAGFTANPREAVLVVVRTSDATVVTDLSGRIGRLPGVVGVAPPQQLDAGNWLLQVDPRDGSLSDANQQLVEDVRALPSAAPVLVGGESARFVDLKASLADKLPVATLIVVLTSVVLLALMTGSLLLPVLAVVMNALSLGATFGILVLIFQDGWLGWLIGHEAQGALDATQPVLLFALVFGLSIDYGVFLLARIKEARDQGHDELGSIVLGVGRVGRIVSAAAILFCVALGALAISQIVFIKELGVGTAVGVLIDATIVRAFLMPALMALLGRWNWWGPGPLQWLHRRFGLREDTPVAIATSTDPRHGDALDRTPDPA
jgi:uncharacterized membrane protein YdfJ with MMPL/SSD domain